jgi:hypothetical protein
MTPFILRGTAGGGASALVAGVEAVEVMSFSFVT